MHLSIFKNSVDNYLKLVYNVISRKRCIKNNSTKSYFIYKIVFKIIY